MGVGRDGGDGGGGVGVLGVGRRGGLRGVASEGAGACGKPAPRRLRAGLAAFPTQGDDGGLAYAASNPVGDAVVLYALTLGPLWQRLGGAT